MPIGSVKTPADEKDWEEAKKEARASKPDDFYALAMHIFQAKKKKATSKAANPMTREDASPVGADPNDQLDRRASAEIRKRPRFVIGSKPSPIGKSEHPDDRRERNAKPSNRAARREYMKTEVGRAANRKAQESYRSSHPERVQAQHEARAEHGESKDSGHKCAVCGKPATHKHHNEGYGDGDGAKIRWLCHEHHVKAHYPKSDLKEKAMIETFYISTEFKEKLNKIFGVDPLRKGFITTGALNKHLFDYGESWYEAFRGTPLFTEAVKLEQGHMLHEVERRQKEKQREAARRERERANDKEESVWEWDRKWYDVHDAKVADLKRRHLDHIAAETKANGLERSAPSEHGPSTSPAVSVTKASVTKAAIDPKKRDLIRDR